MAHFAKLGVGNIVEQVVVVSNDIATTEQAGVEFLQNLYKDRAVWKKTSYNTFGNKHYTVTTNSQGDDIKSESSDQSKALRGNYAGKGYFYDQQRDAFIAPKPYRSWTLNEDTCLWEAPVARPDDDNIYTWNETTTSWDLIE